MLIGFTILSKKVQNRDAAIRCLQEILILDYPAVANNIVDAAIGGSDINVFPSNLDLSKLRGFSYSPIVIDDGEFVLVSAVDFKLEITHNNELIVLRPTEYIKIAASKIADFAREVKQGLVKILPCLQPKPESDWILSSGRWNDGGRWVDSEKWID